MPEGISLGSVKKLGYGSYCQTKRSGDKESPWKSPLLYLTPRSPQLKHSSPVIGEELYRPPDPTWALDGF